MTTALDTLIAAKVVSVLAKYGVDATFTIELARGYDPETGKSTRIDTQTHTVKATPPAAYSIREIDGERVRASDMRIYISGANVPFTLDIGQTVAISGQKWTVVAIGPVKSGDDVALYECQVRR